MLRNISLNKTIKRKSFSPVTFIKLSNQLRRYNKELPASDNSGSKYSPVSGVEDVHEVSHRFPPRRMTDMGPTVSNPPEVIQDGPPPGGFPPVRIRRKLASKFWSPFTITFILIIVMIYGWMQMYTTKKITFALNKEQSTLEFALLPFLQGEHDISFVIQQRAFQKTVGKLMAGEEDFDPYQKFYTNPKRFIYPMNSFALDQFKGTGALEREPPTEEEKREIFNDKLFQFDLPASARPLVVSTKD